MSAPPDLPEPEAIACAHCGSTQLRLVLAEAEHDGVHAAARCSVCRLCTGVSVIGVEKGWMHAVALGIVALHPPESGVAS